MPAIRVSIVILRIFLSYWKLESIVEDDIFLSRITISLYIYYFIIIKIVFSQQKHFPQFANRGSTMTIFLLKKIIRKNPCFGSSEMLSYLGLKLISNNTKKDIYYISVDQILAELFETTEVSRSVKQEIKRSIEYFNTKELIKIIKQLGKTEWLIDVSPLTIDTKNEKYQLIDLDDIRRIWAIEEKDYKKMNMINYYCVLMTTLDYKTFVGNSTYNQIYDVLQWATNKTICEYNKILEQNKIIYIYHTSLLSKDAGDNIKSLPNFYGRYDNKEFVDKEAKEYIKRIRASGKL